MSQENLARIKYTYSHFLLMVKDGLFHQIVEKSLYGHPMKRNFTTGMDKIGIRF